MSVWPDERLATVDSFNTVDMTINVGPQHPTTHGVFRMVLTVDGEVVVDCEPYIGYLHRGLEKLTENHDYRQSMGWWDRTDYLAGMCCEFAYCMAVEKLGNIAVPERQCQGPWHCRGSRREVAHAHREDPTRAARGTHAPAR